jgi:hypothetical protein
MNWKEMEGSVSWETSLRLYRTTRCHIPKMLLWIILLFIHLRFPLSTNKSWGTGFQVITAMKIKGSVFWDITPCSPLKFKAHFGRIYRTHLEVLRLKQTKNNQNIVCCLLLLVSCLDYSSTRKMEVVMLLRNRNLGGAWVIDGFWIGWLDLLTPYTQYSELQVIQRYRWSTRFTVHCYTCTRYLSLH